ncbi:hypothetical protein RND71_002642 [Anisodus tanguticus]|uniref:RNase III domain-containing protein n=1 Tax=Anisodus tanguticus TaxID=243964 RepID=A0AAE1VTL4_9SOLA|nr:hypothetical protein RND71_002642 [Anisodus tanguticus]
MATSIRAVEEILNYKFKKTELLEEALTHPSCTDSPSYQRLKFLGVLALGLAISIYVYLTYPKLNPDQLSLLGASNISIEKLAKVTVHHCLYKYVRHNTTGLDEKVKKFVMTVGQEQQAEFHGGAIKALEVLANIVESVADSVYVDCDFDLKAFLNKENAELHAALKKLSYESTGKLDIEIEPKTEIGGAKQKLNEICGRKKWPTLDTFIFYKMTSSEHYDLQTVQYAK